jgi:hypothetical protein
MQLCIYLRLSKYPIQRTSTRNNLGAVHQRLQSQKLNRCPYRGSRHGAATLLFRACLDDKNCSHCIVYYSSTLLSDRSDCGWCINVLMWVARFWCSECHAGLSATPTNTVPCPCTKRAASQIEPRTPKHQTPPPLQRITTPPIWNQLTPLLQQLNCANQENSFRTGQLLISLV